MDDALLDLISFCDQRLIAVVRKLGFTPDASDFDNALLPSGIASESLDDDRNIVESHRRAQLALKVANRCFREKNFKESFYAYNNIRLFLCRLADQNKQQPAVQPTTGPVDLDSNASGQTTESKLTHAVKPRQESKATIRIAVLLHAFHLGIIDETARYLDNIPLPFDLYVTTPHDTATPELKQLISKHPGAIFIKAPNKGRDVLPFLTSLDHLTQYDICLKIHTKQGLTNYGDLWRSTALGALLGSANLVSELIKSFAERPSIAMAGPAAFYISGRNHIYGNRDAIRSCCDLLELEYKESKDWAFFAGTMFWFRPSLLIAKYQLLPTQGYAVESGKQDGALEHAIERMFGLIPSYASYEALLVKGDANNFKIERTEMPKGVTNDEPTKYLEAHAAKLRSAMKLSGDVNKQSSGPLADMKIRGWLASIGNEEPRHYTIRIGDHTLTGTASFYRHDLEKAGINNGCHGIEHVVPLRFANGVEHVVSLFDTASGLPVATGKYKWTIPKRKYSTFSEYLAWSYTNQLVNAPFTEEDKRALAMMDVVADDLCRSIQSKQAHANPLVSIILPTYNRESTVSAALNSVFNQLYTNWELIIVDDGSTDNTVLTINSLIKDRDNITFITCKTNGGVSKARNIGIEASSGDFIAYLDSDNTWDTRYLQAMIGANCRTGFAHGATYSGQLLYSGKQRELSGFRFGHFNKSLLANNNYIDLNSFIHKRALTSTVGLFDESLKRCVDWEFISRIAAHTSVLSVPILLSNYFLLAVDNTITGNISIESHVDKARKMVISNFNMNTRYTVNTEEIPISVVIPSYRAADSLRKCLKSLGPLMGNAVSEIVVVDNNSDSETLSVIRDFSEAHRNRVKVVLNSVNLGFTLAVNIGINNCDVNNDVLLLNNDAIVAPMAINVLHNCLKQHTEVGIAVPGQILFGGTETIANHVPYANPEYDVDVNVSTHHGNLKRLPLFYSGEGFDVDFAPFFCALIRRSVLQRSNNLDASNGRHYRSDRTLCSFVTDVLGLTVRYCPDAVVYHQLQASTKLLKKTSSSNPEFKYIFEENTWSEEEIKDLKILPSAWNYSSLDDYETAVEAHRSRSDVGISMPASGAVIPADSACS